MRMAAATKTVTTSSSPLDMPKDHHEINSRDDDAAAAAWQYYLPDGAATPIRFLVAQRILALEISAISQARRSMTAQEAAQCLRLVKEFPGLCLHPYSWLIKKKNNNTDGPDSEEEQAATNTSSNHYIDDDYYYCYYDDDDEPCYLLTTLVRLPKVGVPLSLIQTVHEYHPDAILKRSSRCSGRQSILHFACQAKASLDVIQYLHEQLPNAVSRPNRFGEYPLHTACRRLWHKDDDNRSKDDDTVIQFLLQVYPEAAGKQDLDGAFPVHEACLGGARLEILKLLHNVFPDATTTPDSEGTLPLHLACAYRRRTSNPDVDDSQQQVIAWLIQQHDRQQRPGELVVMPLQPTELGWTPLMYAAAFQSLGTIQYLWNSLPRPLSSSNYDRHLLLSASMQKQLYSIAALHTHDPAVVAFWAEQLSPQAIDVVASSSSLSSSRMNQKQICVADSPLHLACQERDLDCQKTLAVVQELVKRHFRLLTTGAMTTATSAVTMTPLEICIKRQPDAQVTLYLQQKQLCQQEQNQLLPSSTKKIFATAAMFQKRKKKGFLW